MSFALRPTLTPARRAWLEKLANEGPSYRPPGPTGHQCMQAGWTEWYYRLKDGREMSESAFLELYPRELDTDRWKMIDTKERFRDCITPAGLAVLRSHGSREGRDGDGI